MAFGYDSLLTPKSDRRLEEEQAQDNIQEPLPDGAGGWLSELPAVVPVIMFNTATQVDLEPHAAVFRRFIVDAVKTEAVNGGWDRATITYVCRHVLRHRAQTPCCGLA